MHSSTFITSVLFQGSLGAVSSWLVITLNRNEPQKEAPGDHNATLYRTLLFVVPKNFNMGLPAPTEASKCPLNHFDL